jgi:hypothetical protein
MAGHKILACKKLDNPLSDVSVEGVTDVVIGDRVKAAGDHHVAVGVNFHRPDLAQGEGVRGKRQKSGLPCLSDRTAFYEE